MKLKEITTPQWMLDLFKAIDQLDFSEDKGFKIFDSDVEMHFANDQVKGLENVKSYFKKIDEPFITKHYVDQVFNLGKVYIMIGSAVLTSKNDTNNKPIEVTPLLNILWLNDHGKLERYTVDVSPSLIKNI